jgi:parvulin-like peptidyl-prolyl cis-trans isomerase-like protein
MIPTDKAPAARVADNRFMAGRRPPNDGRARFALTVALLSTWGWWAIGPVVWGQAPFAPPPVPVSQGSAAKQVPSQESLAAQAGGTGKPIAGNSRKSYTAPSARLSAPAATAPKTSARPDPAVPSATRGSYQQPPAIETSPAQLIEGGQIVARVDGQVILASDVLWQVKLILEENRANIPPGEEEKIRTMLLRRQVMGLIDTKMLYGDFRRTVPAENLPKIEKQFDKPFEEREIPRLIKIFGVKDRAELVDRLRENGSSLESHRRAFIEQAIAGEWIRQRLPKPKPVTHEQMLEYYNAHLADYEFPAKTRWEELMVRFNRFGDDRVKAWRAIAEMGNQIWQQVLRKPDVRGPVFAELAKAQSHGFTATDGGLHDWTTHNSLQCQALNDALNGLKIGQLSNILESGQGYHIVRVLERKEAGRTSFVDAQAGIRKKLVAGQRNGLMVKEIEKARKGSRVWTLFDGNLSPEQLAMALGGNKRQ